MLNPLIVGSYALRVKHLDGPAELYNNRGNDIDLIATYDQLQGLQKALKGQLLSTIPLSANKTFLWLTDNGIIEVEIAWPGSAAFELLIATRDTATLTTNFSPLSLNGMMISVPDLDHLYTLKLSHRYLRNSVHFAKTRHDILAMRTMGARIWSESWLKQREEETYTYAHPSLKTSKKAFFKKTGSVKYVYDHDTIHLAMASWRVPKDLDITDKLTKEHTKKLVYWSYFSSNDGKPLPAYEMYKGEGEVLCDRVLFETLPLTVRLTGVLEEAYVLALERSQIPYGALPDGPTPRQSFEIALEKVCTSITSGWFREFAWENYDRVMDMYEDNYVARFWAAVTSGLVKQVSNEP